MSTQYKNLFINSLKHNKDITKEDIMRVGEEYGLEFKKRISRDNVIDLVASEHFDRLEAAFLEFLYVPAWEVADRYVLTTEMVNKLNDIGVIKENYKVKEFYSRRDKDYYSARTYPLEVLINYNGANLKAAYDEAYGKDGYNIRIETKKKEEIDPLLEQLEKIFEITRSPREFEHRNENGFYAYFTIKSFVDSDIKKDALRLEIDNLNKKIAEIKEEEARKREKVIERVFNILEIEGDGYGEIYKFKREFDNVQKENEQLKAEIKSFAGNSNAGRKSKFTTDEKNAIYMNHLGGKSIRAIATEFDCSTGLVHKIIKEKSIIKAKV